ncbi:ankyrin repeat domain-containing protein [Falsihalocynthiibacter arcticus]|uniref:ankyrin repeat domain-containing protein n=1 Tax=Falsihalocynthiibacter arcticus TaxID=1579316 RepID=UPI0030038659
MPSDAVNEKNGKLIKATIEGDEGAVKVLIRTEDVNSSDENGWTALHIAAREGRVEITQILLAQPDLNVNAMNKWKSTPLMISAGSGNLTIIDLLLRHPRISVDLQGQYYKRTALIEAAVQGHISVVKTLIAHGANVNIADKTGRNSALIEALKNGHDKVSTFLLRSGLVDFSDRDLRLQALIWCGSRGSEVLHAELNSAMQNSYRHDQKAVS